MTEGRTIRDRRARHRLLRPTAIIAALAMVLVACTAGSGTLSNNSQPDTSPPPADGTPASQDPEAGAILIDSFAEPGPLLAGGTDLAWAIPLGGWQAVDGSLRHQGPVAALPSIAIIDTGSPNGLVQATFREPADWAGLTFRYRDLTNYWAIIGAPNFGTWNLIKVVDGEPFDLGNVGSAPVEPGTTIGVLLDGDRISIIVNAQALRTVVDDTHAAATAAGMYAGQDTASNAIWDDFMAIPARPAELTIEVSSNPPELAPTPTPGLAGLQLGTPTPAPPEVFEVGDGRFEGDGS